MKNLFVAAVVCAGASVTLTPTFASNKIVYGSDDRHEIHESRPEIQKLALSTAGMVKTVKLLQYGDQLILPPENLKESLNVCAGEKFSEQLSSVTCSGFLVGPDLLVTAGHCINTQEQCEEQSWVFDYKVDKVTKRANTMFSKDKAYKCKRVVDANFNPHAFNGADYSLIQLDRVVTDREPLEYNATEKIADGESIYVIGYPSGLPAKFADGASVFNNDLTGHFETNLDTFAGNSGSSVFNAMTDKVEGILVRGGQDYTNNNGCNVVNQVTNTPDFQNKEDVTRLSMISTLKYRDALITAARINELDTLEFLLNEINEINIYDNQKNTALHHAAMLGNDQVVEVLLQHNVDINVVNLDGKTALDLAKDNGHESIVEMLDTLQKYLLTK